MDIKWLISIIPDLIKAIPLTLYLAALSIIFGLLLGFLIAIIKMHQIKVLYQLANIFTTIIRGVPMMVQLYLSYYAIPLLIKSFLAIFGYSFNITAIPGTALVIIALTCNYSAYFSETIRASLQAIDKGQYEAASSIGMSPLKTMVRIIIPQALVVALPNLCSLFICILKDTSLAYMITVNELMGTAKILAGFGYNYFEAYAIVALIYWAIDAIISAIFKHAERRAGHFINIA